ncbi:MAG: APC family permease [Novosphingobium sp.]|uniref:APC family permease n=1 Tax=Novosphingobium sp. TaxID=1874826 RepID=UPI00301893F7
MKPRRQLGLAEATGLSLSIVAPTMAMAFNVTLVVAVAGRAAPLAFAIGTALLALVGFSFVTFAQRETSAGSAQAYVCTQFGPRAGFLAGWMLLLSYLCFGAGTAVLVGHFASAAIGDAGIRTGDLWIPVSVTSVAIGLGFSWRDMQSVARLILVLELVSVAAIAVLSLHILWVVAQSGPLPAAPFFPDPDRGWVGIGLALVFTVLSFAGFEGAATVAEETKTPQRAIPLAILGTIVLSGVFYVFAAYAQVVGYAGDGLGDMAQDSAPLDTLARRYGTASLAACLNIAAALSAFSCVLGSLNAAARMIMVLARDGQHALARLHHCHGTPTNALALCATVITAFILIWAARVGVGDFYGYIGTIGSLALILVYIGVCMAHAAFGRSRGGWAGFIAGGAGTAMLIWPLYNSLDPVPVWPGNLWPYVVLAWLAAGAMLSRTMARY